ncbi:hypothetical protein BHC44_07310 [Snodgrassella alvi]|nr:hypothetical protein BHC44_07310 [Snodgrassella alvi]
MFNLSAWAQATKTNTTVETQFEAALLCKSAPIDARDSDITTQLNKQKITVKNLDKDGLINLEYHLTKPLQIANASVSVIRYLGDSGSYFFAVAKGDMATFAKSIDAKPVPVQLKEILSWGNISQYYQYTTDVTADNPYPDTILIGRDKTSKQGEFYFGCLRFDY